ncbi:MAG: hypothetical protein V7K50_20830 [Nostoc sp.]
MEYTAPAEPAITFDDAIAIPAELAIVLGDKGSLESTAPVEPAITFDDAIAVPAELAIVLVDKGNLESTAPVEPAITLDDAIAVPTELAVKVVDESNLESTAPAEPAITFDDAIAVPAELAVKVVDESNLESTAPAEPVITFDEAIAVPAELAVKVVDESNLESTAPAEPVITFDEAIAVPTELAVKVVDESNLESTAPTEPAITFDDAIAIPAELAVTTHSNSTSSVLLDETEEDIVIDEPVSPVWLKGETAEQILQNLIDLALPASELLPKDEKVIDSPATQTSPPLLLTLGQDNYISPWGQALAINGHIELKEKINLDEAEILSPKSLRELELGIELRSPKNSKMLTKVWQPLPDQELPFTINTSIDIPADCESKLILADISLYGKFADTSEVTRLASQSFTITADVTELLAITAAAKSSALSYPVAPSDLSTAFTEPEAPVRLDLKLLNLVKIPKTDQSQILNPSPNRPLPPQINLQVLREATLRTSNLKNSGTSPQLPKLPPVQIDTNIPTDVVVKLPAQEELLEKDATIAAINLEQLVIRQRRMPILVTTLPYLKRLQALPGYAEEEARNNDPLGALEVQAAEDFPQLEPVLAEYENIPELLVDDAQFQEEFVGEIEAQQNTQFQEEFVGEIEAQQNTQFQEKFVAEVEAQQNTQFITTANLYSSPLLRKWMQSQGYSLPESINDLEPQDYDNYVPAPQIPLSLSAENTNVDVNLPLNLDANTETSDEGWGRSELILTETLREQDIWQEVQGLASELGNFGEDVDIAKEADLERGENTELEKVLEEAIISSALITQLPPPPPPIKINIASAWLAKEIVVDDTDGELEADATRSYTFEEKQPLLDLSPSKPIIATATEPLPIPELYVPEGELIAGKSVIVRVVLPEVPPQVVVKLWVEDYQTRWLLDGPHLLTNLLPNAFGGLEVMTQLNIPFGCLEIRLEAIALDLTTQHESHKVTILRTVIPPDLPSLQLDELLGM